MTDYMDVSTGSLRHSATDLSGAADAIAQALSQFTAALSGTADGFGSDEISGPFAREYEPLVNRGVTAIVSYQDQLTYASRGLSLTASLLERSETVGAEALARLRAPWRPPPGP